MPLYEYECKQCGHRFEKIVRSYSSAEVKECPVCKGEVEQLISAPAVQFKGSGFYSTDYAKPAPKSGQSSGDGGKDSANKPSASGDTAASGSAKPSSSEGTAPAKKETTSGAPAADKSGKSTS